MLRPLRQTPDQRGAPAWVITYADLMSLLLTFFILLAAFSTVNPRKIHQAISSIQDALGVQPLTPITLPVPQFPVPQAIERVARELQRRVQVMGHDANLNIRFEQDGLRIVLPEGVTFETARAELKPDCYHVLDTIGELLSTLGAGARVEVRGHTDSRPLLSTGHFRDNHELSFARADAVARRLSQVGKMPLEQFESIACGAGQPAATNDTPEGQQANRRVEIFVRAEVRSTMGSQSVQDAVSRVNAAAPADGVKR